MLHGETGLALDMHSGRGPLGLQLSLVENCLQKLNDLHDALMHLSSCQLLRNKHENCMLVANLIMIGAAKSTRHKHADCIHICDERPT